MSFERDGRTLKSYIKSLSIVMDCQLQLNNSNSYFVAGGVFASRLLDENPMDIDIFATKGMGFSPIKNAYKGTHTTTDSTLYKQNQMIDDVYTFDCRGQKIQLIKTQFQTRKEAIEDFDLEHCKVSYNIGDDILYMSHLTYMAIKNRWLIPTGKQVVSKRVEKFIKRGWTFKPSKKQYDCLMAVKQFSVGQLNSFDPKIIDQCMAMGWIAHNSLGVYVPMPFGNMAIDNGPYDA